MRFLSCTLVVLAACCCSSARSAPHAPSSAVQHNPLHKVNHVRGGGDLTSTSPPKTVGLGRVMNLRTALEYKGFAIAETGLLLGVLQLARKLALRHPLDIKYMRAVDYTAWAVIGELRQQPCRCACGLLSLPLAANFYLSEPCSHRSECLL
eukprot:TRINITY_DN1423_c0_g1_i5.p1 TRINITY_DN1423_c0_g1~~TRINITY_DN1423_c0_g1_i5.p1  ORF type:complete len:151 (-),score=6.88 TRINITY_DN1423_c0_g1_i5:288-740(-)